MNGALGSVVRVGRVHRDRASHGALGDVKVRQALSTAIDRKAYINTLYTGEAQLPRTLANPGTWGYEREVFQEDWDTLPEPTQDVERASSSSRRRARPARRSSSARAARSNSLQTAANAIRQAAISIGLKAKLKSVSAANYINFFTDPKARKGVDGFLTRQLPRLRRPGGASTTRSRSRAAARTTAASRTPGSRGAGRGADDERPAPARGADGRGGRPDHGRRCRGSRSRRRTRSWSWTRGSPARPSSFQYMGGPWAATIGGSG